MGQHTRLLTAEEAAQSARISRTKMFELIKTGEIQSIKIGRSRRIPVDALDEYVARLIEQQRGAA